MTPFYRNSCELLFIGPSYYRVQQRYFEEINENECAYLYDDADRILNMNNIDFDMDDVRIGNPRDIEIDDWDVRMFTIVQLTMRLLYLLK